MNSSVGGALDRTLDAEVNLHVANDKDNKKIQNQLLLKIKNIKNDEFIEGMPLTF